MSRVTQAYSPEERAKYIKQIEEYRNDGMSIIEAAKKAGLPWGTYYSWSRHRKPKARTRSGAAKARKLHTDKVANPPVVMQYAEEEGELLIVKGRPNDVVKALALLTQGGRY